MQEIEELIKNYKWAGVDSITFEDGKMIVLDVNFYGYNHYSIRPKLESTIQSYLKYNRTELSSFDVFSSYIFNDHEVFAGGGSYEGEGIIYILDKNKSLYWFVFFENSDVFTRVEATNEGFINAFTEDEFMFKIEISNPLNIELIYPKKK